MVGSWALLKNGKIFNVIVDDGTTYIDYSNILSTADTPVEVGAIGYTSLAATSPLLYDSATGTFSIQQANASQPGFLSAADWIRFDAASGSGIGLASLSALSPLLYNNTTGVFSIQQANTSQSGFLSSTDWNTFNNKLGSSAIGSTIQSYSSFLADIPSGVSAATGLQYLRLKSDKSGLEFATVSSTSISASSPLSYNSGTGALSIQQANTSQSGFLSSTDWNTFNSKLGSSDIGVSVQAFSTRLSEITSNYAAATNGQAIVKTASGLAYQTITTSGSFSATSPLSYNSGTGVFSIQQANTSQSGFLSSTDWNTFNNKASLTAFSASLPIQYNNSTGAFTLSSDFNGNTITNFTTSLNQQTGVTYTLQTSDRGKIVELSNASAITVTLPNSLPQGFSCLVVQSGAGQVTLTAASGATLLNRQSFTKTAGQNAGLTLYVRSNTSGTNAVYVSIGDMTA